MIQLTKFTKPEVFKIQSITRATIISVLLLVTTSCARYQVGVNSYVDSDTSILTTKSVYVLVDSKVSNPLFAKEIGTKIENYLKAKGYKIAPDFSDSAYVITFAYNIDSGVTTSSSNTYTTTSYKLNVYTGKYELVPKTNAININKTTYARFLVVTLLDTQTLLKTQEAMPLWVAEVTSKGSSSDLRKAIDYLIIAAFDYYGVDTKGKQEFTISKNDERVQKLY